VSFILSRDPFVSSHSAEKLIKTEGQVTEIHRKWEDKEYESKES
jgi:hypothetical protein